MNLYNNSHVQHSHGHAQVDSWYRFTPATRGSKASTEHVVPAHTSIQGELTYSENLSRVSKWVIAFWFVTNNSYKNTGTRRKLQASRKWPLEAVGGSRCSVKDYMGGCKLSIS